MNRTLLLSVVTLGVYYFWGKTRVRAYAHSQMEFAGDRFAYHGTGKELLVGGLKAVALFVVVYGGVGVIQARNPGVAATEAAVIVLYAFTWSSRRSRSSAPAAIA